MVNAGGGATPQCASISAHVRWPRGIVHRAIWCSRRIQFSSHALWNGVPRVDAPVS